MILQNTNDSLANDDAEFLTVSLEGLKMNYTIKTHLIFIDVRLEKSM